MVVVATDIGGTFTDIVALEASGRLTIGKVLSTPADYADGLLDGVAGVSAAGGWPLAAIARLLHGCTVATNAVLEKKARTVLVTTAGFRDVLELRRIRVPRLYEPLYQRPDPLVPRDRRLEVVERVAADGSVVTPLDPAELDPLVARIAAARPEAIAVCLINAHANPTHERMIGAALAAAFPQVFLSLSVDVLPELREYERTSTTVVNAYVGPAVARYLASVETRLNAVRVAAPLMLMQSSGGMIESGRVRRIPAALLECGPAAGVIGAARLGAAAGFADLLTFDMGGTTAKAALVKNGAISYTDCFEVGADISTGSVLASGGGYAVKLPAVDIAEVGAGGGSLVGLDPAGAIRVGPESAGARPGPACYGFGNDRPTVTDANVVLGYIDPEAMAGGRVRLDRALAIEAIRRHVAAPLDLSIEEAAFGVCRVANASMVRALKTVSVYRGHDPRLFRLFAFGGNGGLHGPQIARELGIREVVVPPAAGVFSAVGLLLASPQSTRTWTHPMKLEEFDRREAERVVAGLRALVARDLAADPGALSFQDYALCRYSGQAYELPVPLSADLEQAFAASHQQRYGHCPPPGTAVEIVSFRVIGTGASPPIGRVQVVSPAAAGQGSRPCYFGKALGWIETEVTTRQALGQRARQGPVIVAESDGTTLVPPGAAARLDAYDNIIIALDGREV